MDAGSVCRAGSDWIGRMGEKTALPGRNVVSAMGKERNLGTQYSMNKLPAEPSGVIIRRRGRASKRGVLRAWRGIRPPVPAVCAAFGRRHGDNGLNGLMGERRRDNFLTVPISQMQVQQAEDQHVFGRQLQTEAAGRNALRIAPPLVLFNPQRTKKKPFVKPRNGAFNRLSQHRGKQLGYARIVDEAGSGRMRHRLLQHERNPIGSAGHGRE